MTTLMIMNLNEDLIEAETDQNRGETAMIEGRLTTVALMTEDDQILMIANLPKAAKNLKMNVVPILMINVKRKIAKSTMKNEVNRLIVNRPVERTTKMLSKTHEEIETKTVMNQQRKDKFWKILGKNL